MGNPKICNEIVDIGAHEFPQDSEPEPPEPNKPEPHSSKKSRHKKSNLVELEPKLNKEDHFAYIIGYEDNTVRPENNITRGEVAAIFFRLLGPEYRETIKSYENNFTDVEPNIWCNKHISTLAKGNIILGYPDNTFKQNKYITRAELAAIVSRFDKLEERESSAFADVKGHWAEKYIDSAVEKGWINGYPDGTFKPDNFIKRAEVVNLINKVLGRKVRRENMLPNRKKYDDLYEDKWYYEAFEEAINSHIYERLEDGSERWLELINPDIEM